MGRAGFVFRFLKPCAVAAFMTVLAACGGGGGGEPVRIVTTVTVSSPTLTPKQGDSVQLTAVARDQFGEVMSGTTASWSSSAPSVATVSATGLLQALAGGSVTATATISGVPGSLTLTITPRVTTTVTVGSPTATPTVGETVQLAVVARDQFGAVLSGKVATWSTSDEKVATISSTGLLQAVAPGTVVSTATIDGVPGSLTLTVVPGAAASVTVASPTTTPQAGEAVQLMAVVRDRDGNLVPGAAVVWSTSDARIATVSASGLLQALAPGNVVATATVDGVSGSLTMTVLAAPTWAAVARYDKTYRMDYELDGERRVRSYELRDLASGRLVRWCTGDLHASWQCRDEDIEEGAYAPYVSSSASFDTQGRPVEYGRSWRRVTGESSWEGAGYTFDAAGRLTRFEHNKQGLPGTEIITTSGTLEYDVGGRLAVIQVRVFNIKWSFGATHDTYTVVSAGDVPTRFLVTRKDAWSGRPMPPDLTIQLEHDGAGHYLRKTISEITVDGERIRSDLQWRIDSRGYLTGWLARNYDATPSPAQEEWGWCLEWSASEPSALASERRCAPPAASGSLVYAYGRLPSVPLTVFRPYSASSGLDVVCAATGVCIDPARLYLPPF